MNGYNFTERSRRTFAFSREEAARLGRPFVDADHILLGIIREGRGLGAVTLMTLAGDLEDLRIAVERVLPSGESTTSSTATERPFTARGKRVLEHGMAVARELGHSYVGTEYLLLGFLREGQAISIPLLSSLGVTFDRARESVLRLLGDPRAGVDAEAVEVRALAAEIELRRSDGSIRRGEFSTLADTIQFLVAGGMA